MKRTLALGGLLAAAACLGACDRCNDPGSPAPAASAAPAAEAIEVARRHLGRFLEPGADQAALWHAMAPREEDYSAVFVGEAVAKARAHYTAMWKDSKVEKVRKDEQTELLIWAATGRQLERMEGDAASFPSRYGPIARHLNPELTFYAFRFQVPGAKWGMAFDGLVFVHGRWVMFPKPFRALRDRGDAGSQPAAGGPAGDKGRDGAGGGATHSSGGGS